MVMHPLDSLKSGVSWLLEKLGIVSKEAAKAKLPESVTRQQPATVNADGKVMMPSGGFPSWDMALRDMAAAIRAGGLASSVKTGRKLLTARQM